MWWSNKAKDRVAHFGFQKASLKQNNREKENNATISYDSKFVTATYEDRKKRLELATFGLARQTIDDSYQSINNSNNTNNNNIRISYDHNIISWIIFNFIISKDEPSIIFNIKRNLLEFQTETLNGISSTYQSNHNLILIDSNDSIKQKNKLIKELQMQSQSQSQSTHNKQSNIVSHCVTITNNDCVSSNSRSNRKRIHNSNNQNSNHNNAKIGCLHGLENSI